MSRKSGKTQETRRNDRMNRLKEETSVFDIDYTYDSMGNRTQEVEGAVTTNYTYSNMMRLLSKTEGGASISFGYDRNGNLTSKTEGNSSYAYVWDYDNRLKEVRQNGNLLFSYTYDTNGRRVRSFNSGTGVTTTYIYSGINVIYETTSTESTDYLYANGMRIAKKTGATVKYFHSDHLGSTRLVTDSSGQPTFESDYKPFGQDANATGTEKYAFTGQYSEADIGLYYFGARWYDASLGRFISEDPIKGSMISSQSQNPYVYCMNNPLRFVDPSGMAIGDRYTDENGNTRWFATVENSRGQSGLQASGGFVIYPDLIGLSPSTQITYNSTSGEYTFSLECSIQDKNSNSAGFLYLDFVISKDSNGYNMKIGYDMSSVMNKLTAGYMPINWMSGGKLTFNLAQVPNNSSLQLPGRYQDIESVTKTSSYSGTSGKGEILMDSLNIDTSAYNYRLGVDVSAFTTFIKVEPVSNDVSAGGNGNGATIFIPGYSSLRASGTIDMTGFFKDIS